MNRWVVITLALMASVVVGRHLHRFGPPGSGGDTAPAVVRDPLGVQVAHAEPLPAVESGAQEVVQDGGALGVPADVRETEAGASEPDAAPPDAAAETRRQRVPLNPEPPLPAPDRPRPSPPQGPLTSLDPHQMLFEPGEKPAAPAVRKRRAAAAPSGPLTDVDPRQMLFEPGERAPKDLPSERRRAEPAMDAPAAAPDAASEVPSDASIEPSTDAQTKARIMKRLLRVMELAGEKP
jgi:hypothetical protein